MTEKQPAKNVKKVNRSENGKQHKKQNISENKMPRKTVKTKRSHTDNKPKKAPNKKVVNKKHIKNKKTNLYKKLIAVVGVVILVLLVYLVARKPILNAFYEYKLSQSVDTSTQAIPKGVTIMGNDLEGLDRETAIKKLSDIYKLPEGNALVLESSIDSTKKVAYSYEDLGIDYDIENVVDKAIAFANPNLSDDWFREFKSLESGNIDLSILKYDYNKINKICSKIAKDSTVKMKNATVRHQNKKFIVTRESIGQKVDANKLLDDVTDAIRNQEFGKTIKYTVETVKPEWTAEDFSDINNKIGSYANKFPNGDDDRIANLENGCKKLNGTVLYPNEVLSVNDKFNPCTEENGWKSADTIVSGKIEKSIGGGMCQVSSALYMAVLHAELEVVERYNHSLKVNYMPYSTDAALAGDYKDLKFKNDTDKPILIEAFVANNKVCINIYGKEIHDANRKIKFISKYISTQEPGAPVKQYDPSLPAGTEQVTTTPLAGQTYELYKKVYENDKLVDTVKINTSVYVPRQEVISVGTKQS